jgi:hypothetical protein
MIEGGRLHRLCRVLSSLVSVAAVAATGPSAGTAPATVRDFFSRDHRMRGVCFVAGQRIDESVFAPLVRRNVEWISQTPFGWMSAADSTEVRLVTKGRIYWGETDDGIVATTRMAHRFGIRTILKPHLWVAGWTNTVWTGEIRMKSDADWRKWFDSYRRFIVHYAELAAANGIEALAVGTELQGTALGHEAEWRRLIEEVRKVYPGRITYAANWDHEFEALPFWDAVDFAGVQAYFPLSDKREATVDDLLAGWQRHVKKLESVARRINRPIVFTEVGYKSSDRASVEPWLWRTDDRTNLEEQVRCFEAMFRSVWDRPWFRGVFVWKWFPLYDTRRSASDNNFTPQGKPAEAVLGRWFSAFPSPESEHSVWPPTGTAP